MAVILVVCFFCWKHWKKKSVSVTTEEIETFEKKQMMENKSYETDVCSRSSICEMIQKFSDSIDKNEERKSSGMWSSKIFINHNMNNARRYSHEDEFSDTSVGYIEARKCSNDSTSTSSSSSSNSSSVEDQVSRRTAKNSRTYNRQSATNEIHLVNSDNGGFERRRIIGKISNGSPKEITKHKKSRTEFNQANGNYSSYYQSPSSALRHISINQSADQQSASSVFRNISKTRTRDQELKRQNNFDHHDYVNLHEQREHEQRKQKMVTFVDI